MLVIIENLAKAVAHFCFLSVSITSRLRGVVDAVVTNERTAYSNETEYCVVAKANEIRIAPVATKLATIMVFLSWKRSVTRPQTKAAGTPTALNKVMANATSRTVP